MDHLPTIQRHTLIDVIDDYDGLLERIRQYNDEVSALLLIDGSLDQVAMVSDMKRLKMVRGIADSVLLEAHHIVEWRILENINKFPQFKAGFAKLGWTSRGKMPAISVFNELHTRGSRGLAKAMGTRSDRLMMGHTHLSRVLEEEINPANYQTTRALLEAYEKVYQKHYPALYKSLSTPKPGQKFGWFDNVKNTVGNL